MLVLAFVRFIWPQRYLLCVSAGTEPKNTVCSAAKEDVGSLHERSGGRALFFFYISPSGPEIIFSAWAFLIFFCGKATSDDINIEQRQEICGMLCFSRKDPQ
jgi:hypothetical protein